MAQVITFAGEQLFATKAQNNQPLDIDTFIFAMVPGQDPNTPINRAETLPPIGQRVYTQIVQQTGKVNNNVVIYSTVMDSTTGPFNFNWVGLYSSVNNVLVAIQHIPTTPKTITVPGAAGNTLNRNFGIEYSGIAELAGINVDAETWQLDYTARLNGMDELTRQLAADMNGKDWFIGDGFKVEPRSTLNTFKVIAGVGYVSGLRVELEADHILTLSAYPRFVYVDAWFDGTSESVWKGQTAFTVTSAEMDDYIDVNGKQHYVAKIASITNASTVNDLRNTNGLRQEIEQHMEQGGHESKKIDWTDNGVTSEDIAATASASRLMGYSIDSDVSKSIMDNFQRTSDIKAMHAKGIAESGSLSENYNFSRIDGIGVISTTPEENHSWMAPATGLNWIKVRTPFSVIIGDSIAEGHPGCHGRLHASYETPIFNDSIKNQYGSPAFELSRRTGMHWFNHGIGGQTTQDVLERFERDAIGEVKNVGDGRPNKTLPSKPVCIWVNAGINDVSEGISAEVTKQNLLKMLLMAKKEGLIIGFNTIGPVNSHSTEQNEKQDDINRFILTVLPIHGAKVFDYKSWLADPLDRTRLKSAYDADGVHPNKAGYTNYVSSLLDNNDLPIYLNGFWLETGIGEFISSNYRQPRIVSVQDNEGVECGQFEIGSQVEYIQPSTSFLTGPDLTIKIIDVVGGVSPLRHSGFTAIKAAIGFKSKKEKVGNQVEPNQLMGAHIVKSAGTWQILGETKNNGVTSVTVGDDYLAVTFDKKINNPNASMIGTLQPSIYSAIADGVDAYTCRIKSFDPATGAQRSLAEIINNVGFSVSAWSNP